MAVVIEEYAANEAFTLPRVRGGCNSGAKCREPGSTGHQVVHSDHRARDSQQLRYQRPHAICKRILLAFLGSFAWLQQNPESTLQIHPPFGNTI